MLKWPITKVRPNTGVGTLLILLSISIAFCKSKYPMIEVAYYDEIEDLPNHPEKLLVDVREPVELATTGQIPLSINVPLADVEKIFSNKTSSEDFMKIYNRAKPTFTDRIIVYCRTGRRSQIAAETLVDLGYERVKNYKGSWTEWADKNGLPK